MLSLLVKNFSSIFKIKNHFLDSSLKFTVFLKCFNSTKHMEMLNIKDAAKRIVWVDLEMTGLNIDTDHILELACIVTDHNLNVIATGPNIVIHQPDEVLDSMNSWCLAQHGESGLIKASKKSEFTVAAAEKELLDFVKVYVPEKRCPLAGNSIYMDRLFLRKHMPEFNDYLHYRVVDVSSIKELAKPWRLSDQLGPSR